MRTLITAIAATLVLASSTTLTSSANTVQPIAGGTFEASGAVFVDGGVLFVDDGRAEELFWMALDERGRQVGVAQPVALGVQVPDMEGITTDGTHIYVVGSQSKKESHNAAGLARFRFDANARRASDVQSIGGLKEMIVQALPDVGRASGRRVSGFNIEGLAWDPAGKRLLLGLRAPTPEGQALVIPLHHAGPGFDRSGLRVVSDHVVTLPLGGGIRSLEYDAVSKGFRIISGTDSGFAYWSWSGSGMPRREPVAASAADRALKPEGITRVDAGSASYTLVVFDTSRYLAMQ
jgi:hypothetical protein